MLESVYFAFSKQAEIKASDAGRSQGSKSIVDWHQARANYVIWRKHVPVINSWLSDVGRNQGSNGVKGIGGGVVEMHLQHLFAMSIENLFRLNVVSVVG